MPIIKAVFITNIPAPYREPVHELAAAYPDIDYTVFYCAHLEPNRQWKFPLGNYKHVFLDEKAISVNGQAAYLGKKIIAHLNEIRPDVVITGGFSMPMLLAFLWAKLHRAKHIAFSDSNPFHESHLTALHRLLRHIVYPLSSAFLGPSINTKTLYTNYAKNVAFFQTHLCANNEHYAKFITTLDQRPYDVMYCGRICKEKKYDFFVETVKRLQEIRPINVLVVGDGPDRETFSSALQQAGITATFTGFLTQDQLPHYYSQVKVLLFPTERDAWGIVANEALAVGTPVITCPEAGVAGELVIDSVNGHVLPLVPEAWAEHSNAILSHPSLWANLSMEAARSVATFSYENAAAGIVAAIRHAHGANRAMQT